MTKIKDLLQLAGLACLLGLLLVLIVVQLLTPFAKLAFFLGLTGR